MRTGVDALRSLHHFIWMALDDDVPPPWQGQERPWEVRLWGTEGEFSFPFARVAAITPETFSGSAAIRESIRTFAAHLYPVPQDTPEDSIMEVERVEEIVTLAFEVGFSYPEPLMPPYSIQARVGSGGSRSAGRYEYLVTAVNTSGESVAAVALDAVLDADDSVKLLWTAALDAVSYNLYCTGPDDVQWLLANTALLGFTDSGGVVPLAEASPPSEATGLATVRTAPWRIPLYDYAGVPLDGPDSISYRRMPHDFLRVTQSPINRMTDPEDDRYWLITVEPRLTYRRLGRVPSAAPIVQHVTVTQNPG